MRKKPSELDFEEYIRQVEPAKREKSYAWFTAIGLQQVRLMAWLLRIICSKSERTDD